MSGNNSSRLFTRKVYPGRYTREGISPRGPLEYSSTQQYTAAHSRILQHTAAHSSTQQYTTLHGSTQLHTTVHNKQYTVDAKPLTLILNYYYQHQSYSTCGVATNPIIEPDLPTK